MLHYLFVIKYTYICCLFEKELILGSMMQLCFCICKFLTYQKHIKVGIGLVAIQVTSSIYAWLVVLPGVGGMYHRMYPSV